MRWKIGRLGSTDIYLHPASLLTGGYMIFTGYGEWYAATTISILLHETAHALMASVFGQAPHEVEWTPLGALMRMEDELSLRPWQNLMTILAGPFMTLLLCMTAVAGTKHGFISWNLGRIFFMSNLSIFLVNMLPALPLDGGRLTAQILSWGLKPQTVSRVMRAIGTGMGSICIGLNLWLNWRAGGWNLSLSAVGCFLIYSAAVSTTTFALAQLQMLLDRKIRLEKKGSLVIRWQAVSDAQTLQQLVGLLHAYKYTLFSVIERGTQMPVGYIHESEVIAGFLHSPASTAGECIRRQNEVNLQTNKQIYDRKTISSLTEH